GAHQHMGRLKRRLQSGAVSSARRGGTGAGANEVDWPIERTWATDLAAFDTFGICNPDFTHIPDADERSNAVIEQQLALIPDEIVERIPETGENEFAVRINDLRVGRGGLALPPDSHDAIALN